MTYACHQISAVLEGVGEGVQAVVAQADYTRAVNDALESLVGIYAEAAPISSMSNRHSIDLLAKAMKRYKELGEAGVEGYQALLD